MKLMELRASAGVAATVVATCSAIAFAVPQHAAAQQNPAVKNVIPQSAVLTIHAKVEAIDSETRKVTLLGRSGTKVTVTAGPKI